MSDRARIAVVGLATAGAAAESVTPAQLPFVSRSGDTPETRFLLSVAAATLYEEAGRLPEPVPEPPPPCDDGGSSPEPPGLAALATTICAEHAILLRELCERLVERGSSLPPAVLPAAFAAPDLPGRGGPQKVKEAVARAAGPRGRWLAGFNPDWAWVLEEAPADARPPHADDLSSGAAFQEDFAADHFGTRRTTLERWRSADPAAARAALEETWKGETAFRRAALLEAFAAGLSDEDEPFLEAALSDRSKAVPKVAEDLLLRLPESRFSRARQTAADALLAEPPRGSGKLRITLPPATGQQVEGDGGIDWGAVASDGDNGRGVRAERLVRALAAVPPDHWGDRFEYSPSELIGAVTRTEHGEDVIAGWLAASARFAATDPSVARSIARGWAPALSDWAAAAMNRTRRGKKDAAPDPATPLFWEPLTELIAALPPTDAAAFVRPLLETKAAANAPEKVGAPLWEAVPDPWPDDFARAVVAAVEAGRNRRGSEGGYEYHRWHAALPGVLDRLPPVVLADLPPGWPTAGDPPQWLERATAALQIRRRLHELLP